MSTTVDERVVSMQFDNKHFERNVQTSLSTIDKLKQSLNFTGASKGLDTINSAVKNVNMSGLGAAVETVGVRFSALWTVADQTLRNITNSVEATATRMIKALTLDPIMTGFSEYELKMNSVQTIMAGSGESLETVNKYLEELNQYADQTIYSFSDMTSSIGKFTNAGVKLEDAVAAIKGISNEAAVSGANANEASRAMYNFAQALSAGYVKLIDWKSIENANMATVEFKEQLIATAVELGTVKKVGDQYKTTTKDLNGKVSELFDSTSMFNDSLSHQWMTSEVLIETLKDYADTTTEIGKKASAAATEVKTFSQLWDTLKESAQSGWAQTWEIVVGDLGEAKKLLTEISDVIGGMLGSKAEARNNLLKNGLGLKWDALVADGTIFDEKNWSKTLTNIAREHGVAIDEMIEKHGSFEATLREGWLTSDIYSEAVSKTADFLHSLSEVDLKKAGYTKENIEQMDALNESIQNGTVSLDELTARLGGATGRENLIQSLWLAFNGIMSVVEPVKEAFREIFDPITAEQLYNFTATLEKLAIKLTLSEEASENLKRTFKGVFAVLDIVKQGFEAVFTVISPLFGGLDDLGGGILETTASWGDWLVTLSETIEQTGIFTTAAENVAKYVGIVATAITDFVSGAASKFADFLDTGREKFEAFRDVISEKIIAPGVELIQAILEKVSERMTGIKEAAGDMKSGVTVAIDAMSSALANCDFIKILSTLWDGVKSIGSSLMEAFGFLTEGLIDKIGNADYNGILDIINSIIAGGIGVGIMNFLKSVTDTFKNFQDVVDGIVDVFDGVRGCFEAYQTQLKAGTLMKIASAIAILVASIVVVSFIDSEKLNTAIGAISMLFAELMGSMAIFSHISSNLSGVTKACTAMIGISTAVLIMAFALKSLGELEYSQMMTGLVGVIGLTATMIGAVKLLGNGDSAIKGATQMVIFAAAIKILASACEDLAALSWNELAKGLVGVGVLLAEVSLFLNTAKFNGKSISTATGIVILSAAIKILASACADFAQMNWEELAKGLTGIGALLLEVAAFTKLTGNAKGVISTSVALIAIGVAMKVFASAIQDMGDMTWGELARGLVAMAGALLAVTAAVNFMPSNMIGTGVGLIAVSAALVILADALGSMGSMSWEEIGKGLAALGGSMLILAAGLYVMSGTLAGSAAMLVAAGALAILTPVLTTLGDMSWEGIAKGLVSIAGAFAVIGIAGLVLTPLVPTILSLAGAIALIGVGAVGIGAGLMLAGTGLSAVAVGVTALATALAGGASAIAAALTVIIVGVVSLIPTVVAKIGEAIITFCGVIAEGAPAIGEAIKAVVLSLVDVLVECIPALAEGAMQLVVGVLDTLVEYTPQIVDLVCEFIISAFDALTAKIPTLVESAVAVLAVFFSSVTDALSGIDTDVLFKAIIGAGLLAALMAAMSAVAGLIPGAMVGVLGMGLVVAELALVLAAIGALAQIPGLQWLIEEGGDFLQSVGTAIGQFVGGIVGGFATGVSSSFPQIGSDLSAFMTNAQPFIEGAQNIDASMMEGVRALADTILILTAADILSGIASWISGGSSLSDFAEELVPFGTAMKAYSEAVSGIDAEAVTASATAAQALAELATNLPNSGGIVSWFTGENDMADFAKQLVPFGEAMKEYSDAVTGLDANSIPASATAAKALSELADNLPNSGGIVSWFTGDNDISDFAAGLVSFGEGLKDYSDTVVGLSVTAITASVTAINSLVDMINGMSGIDISGVSSFRSAINILGGTDIDGFIANFSGSSAELISAGTSIIDSLAEGMTSSQETLTSTMTTIIDALSSTIDENVASFNTSGIELADSLTKGIGAQKAKVKVAMTASLNEALGTIRGYYNKFYNAGSYLVSGFANGISANTYRAAAKARAMAAAAANAAKNELDEHSPSKVGYEIGDFFGIAFVNAIGDNVKKAYNVSSEMASSAKTGLVNTLSRIHDAVSGKIDVQPTIRPVLDLSDVESGASSIGSMFGLSPSVGVLANVGAINSRMNERVQNGGNTDVVSAINKLRKDISNLEIASYSVGNVTYDDGSNIADAVKSLTRAVKMGRRT